MSESKKDLACSCFCGNIRYTASVRLTSPPTASKCNCNLCRRHGYISFVIPSLDAITLQSPSSMEEIPRYKFNGKDMKRYYCDKCICFVFGGGFYENPATGKKFEIYSMNLNMVEQPQEGIDLKDFKIQYWDGLHDNWMAGQADEPWSGGTV